MSTPELQCRGHSDPVASLQDLEVTHLESYHGAMKRTRAESKLRCHSSSNCHLIRYSSKHRIFRISVKYLGESGRPQFKHYALTVLKDSEKSEYAIDGAGTKFGDIKQLLRDYRGHPVDHDCRSIGKGLSKVETVELDYEEKPGEESV